MKSLFIILVIALGVVTSTIAHDKYVVTYMDNDSLKTYTYDGFDSFEFLRGALRAANCKGTVTVNDELTFLLLDSGDFNGIKIADEFFQFVEFKAAVDIILRCVDIYKLNKANRIYTFEVKYANDWYRFYNIKNDSTAIAALCKDILIYGDVYECAIITEDSFYGVFYGKEDDGTYFVEARVDGRYTSMKECINHIIN